MKYNINKVFSYDSPIGQFKIFFNKKWLLLFNNECLGQYNDPVAAADDVYCQATGSYNWDAFDFSDSLEEVPTDLYEWNYYDKK